MSWLPLVAKSHLPLLAWPVALSILKAVGRTYLCWLDCACLVQLLGSRFPLSRCWIVLSSFSGVAPSSCLPGLRFPPSVVRLAPSFPDDKIGPSSLGWVGPCAFLILTPGSRLPCHLIRSRLPPPATLVAPSLSAAGIAPSFAADRIVFPGFAERISGS